MVSPCSANLRKVIAAGRGAAATSGSRSVTPSLLLWMDGEDAELAFQNSGASLRRIFGSRCRWFDHGRGRDLEFVGGPGPDGAAIRTLGQHGPRSGNLDQPAGAAARQSSLHL